MTWDAAMRLVPLAALSILKRMTRTLDDGALNSRSAFVFVITLLVKLRVSIRIIKKKIEELESTLPRRLTQSHSSSKSCEQFARTRCSKGNMRTEERGNRVKMSQTWEKRITRCSSDSANTLRRYRIKLAILVPWLKTSASNWALISSGTSRWNRQRWGCECKFPVRAYQNFFNRDD